MLMCPGDQVTTITVSLLGLVTRLMLSPLCVVTDCAAVVLCTLFVQSVHHKLAVLYTYLTYAQVDGGGVIHFNQFQLRFLPIGRSLKA